jgi:ribosomal protein S17E
LPLLRDVWWALLVQGRVRTKTVKKASRNIIEKYYQRLTLDFATNQRVCEEVAIIQSKRLRNKIAGFTTVSRGFVCQRGFLLQPEWPDFSRHQASKFETSTWICACLSSCST